MIRHAQNKKVKNATVCSYKGITFKSKLELFAYKAFEKAGFNFKYEPEAFMLLVKFKPEIPVYEVDKKTGRLTETYSQVRDMTYTTDFIIYFKQHVYIVETKGLITDSFFLKWKLFRAVINKDTSIKAVFFLRNQKQILECIELIKKL